MRTIKLYAMVAVFSVILSFTACGTADSKSESQIFAMDTVMLLTAYGKNADAGLDAAEKVINNMDTMLDAETGELSGVNKYGSALVSDETAEIFRICKSVYMSTDGAFNPAVYPLVKAWGFINQKYRVPDDSEINNLLTQMNFDGAELDETNTITLPNGTEISYAAIAKGYTSQAAIEALKTAGVECAILSLGGNVQTLGERKPDGSPWAVAIQDPNDTGSYVGTLKVGETAVITSGGYQRYFEENGKRYHHIIDPQTGYPADNGLISVTVVCADGARADALSTALFVMGEERAIEYWGDNRDFEIVLITADKRVLVSKGLKSSYTPYGDEYGTVYLES